MPFLFSYAVYTVQCFFVFIAAGFLMESQIENFNQTSFSARIWVIIIGHFLKFESFQPTLKLKPESRILQQHIKFSSNFWQLKKI